MFYCQLVSCLDCVIVEASDVGIGINDNIKYWHRNKPSFVDSLFLRERRKRKLALLNQKMFDWPNR